MRITLLLLFALYACQNNQQGKTGINTDVVKTDSLTNNSTSEPGKNDTVINIRFPGGSHSVTVSGKMKGVAHPVTVYIPVTKGNELTALLIVEDSLANIRMNQIIAPDGKADGPFGKELKRAITAPGTYKLIIGENQMQGEEWKGEFSLTVKIDEGK